MRHVALRLPAIPRSIRRVVLSAVWLSTALLPSACVRLKPYERGTLVHPSMSGGRLGGPGEAHVRAVQEGAIGGGAGTEASCGCN